MRKVGVAITTDQKTDVGLAVSRSFVITVTALSLAAVIDTFLIGFLVSILK